MMGLRTERVVIESSYQNKYTQFFFPRFFPCYTNDTMKRDTDQIESRFIFTRFVYKNRLTICLKFNDLKIILLL